ncbi:MAG: DUF2442 domain-containing protein [Candidatus Delongbacteria bacterium]
MDERTLPTILKVATSAHAIQVELSDGRTNLLPIDWYPRVAAATVKERAHWRLIAKGAGVHWVDLDESVSVENILQGRPSGESQSSFQKWIDSRAAQSTTRPRQPRAATR